MSCCSTSLDQSRCVVTSVFVAFTLSDTSIAVCHASFVPSFFVGCKKDSCTQLGRRRFGPLIHGECLFSFKSNIDRNESALFFLAFFSPAFSVVEVFVAVTSTLVVMHPIMHPFFQLMTELACMFRRLPLSLALRHRSRRTAERRCNYLHQTSPTDNQ